MEMCKVIDCNRASARGSLYCPDHISIDEKVQIEQAKERQLERLKALDNKAARNCVDYDTKGSCPRDALCPEGAYCYKQWLLDKLSKR